jgi:hypothetical protein
MLTPDENASSINGGQYDNNWAYQVNYKDPCNFYNYLIGPNNGFSLQRNNWGGGALLSPSDMADQQTEYVRVDFNSFAGFVYFTTALDTNTAYFEWKVQLQNRLSWDAAAADSMIWRNGTTGKSVKPYFVSSTGCGGEIIARWRLRDIWPIFGNPVGSRYPLSNKGESYQFAGDWNGTYIRYAIKADCACGGTRTSTRHRLYSVQDASCECKRVSTDWQTYTVQTHCPGCDTIGMINLNMKVARTNFGRPDNNNDGKPDASGSLDFNKIFFDRSSFGDTVKAVLEGRILGDPTEVSFIPGFTGFRADVICPSADWDALFARVTIRKAGGGGTFVINNVPTTMVGNRARVDMTYTALQALAPTLPGSLLTDQDSVGVEISMRNRQWAGGATTVQYTFGSQYYAYCGQPNPYKAPIADIWDCDNWQDNHQVASHSFTNTYSDNGPVTINGCNAYSYRILGQFQIGGGWMSRPILLNIETGEDRMSPE